MWREFETWLAEEYQPQTVRTLMSDLRTLLTHRGVPDGTRRVKAYRRVVRLYNSFAELEGHRPLRVTFPEAPPKDLRRGGRTRRKKRVLPMDTDSWQALKARLRKDPSKEARVLEWMVATGFRVGDALRIKRAQIELGFRRKDHQTEIIVKGGKGWVVDISGAPRQWKGLLEVAPKGGTVASGIAKGGDDTPGGAAYQRIRRCFHRHTTALGLGKPNLHKIRHTFGNLAADLDPNLSRWIQKVLGHEKPETTDGYTAGSFARRVAEVQRTLLKDD